MSYESALFAMDAGAYDAELLRRATFAWAARTSANQAGIIAGGLLSPTDCQLSAPASGMSVNLSPGEMLIGGTEGGAQGGYGPFRIQSTTNLIIANANPTNPRIDLICATVNDAKYTAPAGGVTAGQAAPIVVTGTPTAGATLTNLLGVGTLPGSSLLIGYVLVPAGATSIVTADISNVAKAVATNQAASALGGAGLGAVITGTLTWPASSQYSNAATIVLPGATGTTYGLIVPTSNVNNPTFFSSGAITFVTPGVAGAVQIQGVTSSGTAPGVNGTMGYAGFMWASR